MKPLVSIGLPVYNGEEYLAEAIESVLHQTYTNLELIISDNGSTDKTEMICRRFAEQDERVRYHQNELNLGASWNYNRTVELARGFYFRWLAADDMLAPTLIEKSVEILESRPEVVLCFSWTKDIDQAGNEIEVKQSTRLYDDNRTSVRYFSLGNVIPSHNCEEVFGLMRIEVLRQTPMIANYTDSDRTLLARLALKGIFYEIPEPMFLHRLHDRSSVRVHKDSVARMAWFDPAKEGKQSFPGLIQMGDMFRAIMTTPLSISDKFQCYFEWIRWTKRRRHYLILEAKQAVSYITNRYFLRGESFSSNGRVQET